jgi:hypothetical protein
MGIINLMDIKLSHIEEVAAVVEVVEAIRSFDASWIPPNINVTFFSEYDLWYYLDISDDRSCMACTELGGIIFHGNELRQAFPNLEITDADTIHPNVHPNCRCLMIRVG